MILSVTQRDSILESLTYDQRTFLEHIMTNARRSTFAHVMAEVKGAAIPPGTAIEDVEQLVDDWVYTKYIDSGFVNDETPCECGRPLRYQHIVEHKQTKEVRKFGIVHLKEHMHFNDRIVKKIQDGFKAIEKDLDEILNKYVKGWTIEQELIQPIPEELIPEHIRDYLRLQLPLLDRDIQVLKRLGNSFSQASTVVRKLPDLRTIDTPVQALLFDDSDQADLIPVRSVLDFELQEAVRSYLHSGVKSVRVMCEMLIKAHHVNNQRYISGKPHIYVPVCKYLDQLVQMGECKLQHASYVDRQYALI